MADFNSVLNRLKKLKDSTDIDERVGSFARGLTNATMQGYRQPVNNFRNNVSATRNFTKTYSYVPKSIGSDISQGFRDIPANIRLMNQNPMEFQKGVSSAVDYSRPGRLLSKGAEGIFEGMTYGGKDIPVGPSTNLAERGAYTAGFLGGSVVSPITKAAGMLGKAPLVKPLQKKLGTQAGRLIAQGGVKKLAGRGIANLSQGVPYSLAYQMSRPVFGERPSAKGLAGDTALDFGLASVPLVGGLLIGANSKSLKNADNITSTRAFSNIKDRGLRAFISDKEAFIRQTAKPLTGEGNVYALGDLLSHNKLFKEYPELRQVFVKFDPNLPSNTLGGYFENSNTIVLNPKGGKNVSTLLHEVQHAIQGVEDMARGSGNKQARADALSRSIRLGKGSVNETDINKAYNSSLGEIDANLTKDSIRLGNKDLRNNQANIYDNYLRGNNIGTSDVLVNKGGRFSSKNTDPLIEEAKKYKSAEEFVKAQINSYHGTNKEFDNFELTEGIRGGPFGSTKRVKNQAIFLSNNKSVAQFFGMNRADTGGGVYRIIEAKTPDKNILDLTKRVDKDVRKKALDLIEAWEGKRPQSIPISKHYWLVDQPEFVSFLKQRGYKGVKLNEGSTLKSDRWVVKTKGGNHTIAVFDPKDIYTKSQLLDIYNQAQEPVLRVKQGDEIGKKIWSGHPDSHKLSKEDYINKGLDYYKKTDKGYKATKDKIWYETTAKNILAQSYRGTDTVKKANTPKKIENLYTKENVEDILNKNPQNSALNNLYYSLRNFSGDVSNILSEKEKRLINSFTDQATKPTLKVRQGDEVIKNKKVYHGGDLNTQTLRSDPTHFGSLDQAKERLGNLKEWGQSTGKEKVQEFTLNGKFKRVEDLGGNPKAWEKDILEAKAQGYDGLVYKNDFEASGDKDSYVVFDPKKLVSKQPLKVKPTGGKQKAQQKLNDLLNYQDKLVKSGLKESEADNISYKQYQKMQAEGKLSNLLDNVPAEADNSIKSTKRAKVIETDTLTPDGPIDIPTNSGFKAEINKIFNPIKNAPAQVQSEVKNWSSKVMTGRARASEVVNRFSNIDEADGWKFIQKFQDPNAKVDLGGKYEKEMVDLRNYYNSIREEGIRRGLDINYLDNYLNQVWKNPPEEVDKALAEYMKQGKSLGKNPSFTKKRVFDTYSDGIKYGLKPKYTHPGQLAAHYRYQLDKAIANRDLVNNLKRLGAIVPSNEAPAGWKTVDTQLIPDIDGFRAEPSVAKSLNNLFSLDKGNAFLRAGANASRYAQQVSLSGGIPGTPMNAFTLGNMIKEVTGGRVKSPVKSFVYAMSDSATKDYFKKNEKYATMMAQEGIRSRAITDYDKAYKNLLDYDGVKGRGQAIADLWNSAMEKPTFERFMPMLELNTFKDTYEEAIKNGVSSKEARRVAGETTKAWHGVADKLSRSTDVDNTLSAVFFAPTFRESMINFWGANAKAMNPRNWADHKYKYNKKFLGGMLVTYVLYNLVNKALTGHYLHENKDGKEFAIEIPRENGRSWFIPMLPSIGTLPRRGLEIAGALKGGDIKTAAQKFGSFFSQPINVGGSLLSNRTFYGGPIYTDEDTAGQKVGKLVGYGAEQLAHPYIGEPIAYMQGRKTPIEALMGAMELPVYPSKSTYASHLVGGQNTKFNSIVKASDDLGKQYAEGVKIKNALTSDKPTKKQLKVLNSVTPDKLDGIALAFGYDNYLGEKPAGDLEYKAYSNEVLSDARSVYNDEEIPESIKKPLIERMGQSYKDVELDAIAQKSVVDKAIYVRDELAKLETPQEKQQFLNDLYHNKTLSDKRIFTDSVAEELGIEDAYKIAQRYSKAKSGSSKKIKLGTTPTFKAPKVSPIKVSATKRAESKPIKLDLKGYSGAGKNTSPIKLGRSKSLDSAIIKLRNLSN